MSETSSTTIASTNANAGGNKPQLSAWIEDGYTRDGYVAAVAGLHPGLSFKFRPARPRVRADIRRQVFRDGNEEDAFMVEIVVKHVVEWTGRAKVDAEGAAMLHPEIRQRMIEQILGFEAPERERKSA